MWDQIPEIKFRSTSDQNKLNNFQITTERRTIQLRVESPAELLEWVENIRRVAFPDKNRIELNGMKLNGQEQFLSTGLDSDNNNERGKPNGFAVKENDLYGSVDDTFCVKVIWLLLMLAG